MLKRAFLYAAVALGLMVPAAARAQFVVADPITHALQQLQQVQLVATVTNGVNQLKDLEQQIMQLSQIFYTAEHLTNAAGMVNALQQLGIQNPLPIDPLTIETMLRGGGGAGFTGILSTLFNANLGANRIYVPNDGTIGSQMLQERLNAVSGGQSVGDTLYQAAGNRIPLIQDLSNQIGQSPTSKDTLDLIARLSAEENISTAQATQAVAASVMVGQSRDQQGLREAQLQLQSDQAWLQEAQARTGDW